MPAVLNVSPHPDDGALGAPMTLAHLRHNGWRVVDVLLSRGREGDHDRRIAEWHDWLARTGFEGIALDPPLRISSLDRPLATEAEIAAALVEVIADVEPDVVMSPNVHDRHLGHELVARAVEFSYPKVWWMYGIWSSLQTPNIYAPFSSTDFEAAAHALDAFKGELERTNFRLMLNGRSQLNVPLKEATPADAFNSFGSEYYAELMMEVIRSNDGWLFGTRRTFDVNDPLPAPSETDVSELLSRVSDNTLLDQLQSL